MTQPPTVTYEFRLPDGSERSFTVEVSSGAISHREPEPDAPAWTALDFHKCSHCPLDSSKETHCPASLSIWEFVEAFDDLDSFDTVDLRVVTPDRTVIFDGAPLQTALRSLMGLVLPMSGCPHTDFFRPMARFHLPMASVEETIYRAASMHMLSEWFELADGGTPSFDLMELGELYENVKVVDKHILQRLSQETSTDSSRNAVVLLYVQAQFLPMALQDSLSTIRPYFKARAGEELE